VTAGARRELAHYGIETYGLSERQACRLFNISRTVYRYQAKKADDSEIETMLMQLAEKKPRWGFGKMFAWLRHHGHRWNHKRVHRVYRELSLNLRVKPKKRLPKREPQPLSQPEAPNACWSMDFMSDALVTGRTFRTFNVIDDFNRELLWIEVDTSLPAERVIRVLELPAGAATHSGCAATMVPNLSLSPWPGGPSSITLNWHSFNQANQLRMPTSNVSIAPTVRMCWMLFCSIPSKRFAISMSGGWKNTMAFGLMNH